MFSEKILAPLVCCVPLVSPALAGEFVGKLRESALKEIEKSETDALFRHAELSQQYIAALKGLESRFTAEGNLDAIIRLREEIQSITDSGEPAPHGDKAIVELREKYVAARSAITKQANDARAKILDATGKALREREAELTKAGQIEQALAMRKEAERMLLELSAGTSNDDVEFSDDPRGAENVEAKELPQVEVPAETPPLFEQPFSIKGRWLESMTLPVMKQRITAGILIGDPKEGKRPLIAIPKGSVWSGKGTEILLSFGRIVATKSSFEELRFRGDQGSLQFFVNCRFQDCVFTKGGSRLGGEQATKYYFGNCVVTGRLASTWNVRHTGYRGQSSVFEKLELPEISFEGREPARYVNHPWVKFSDCRFVNCKVPSSFAAITRDCIFENCEFVDDPKFRGGSKPFEVVLYLNPGCRWNISKAPAALAFTRKPDAERQGAPPPTAQALKEMMGF